MVSAHMLNKICLSKALLFQGFFNFVAKCNTCEKRKHLLKVSRFDKFVVKTISCLLSLSFYKLWATNYQNRGSATPLLKLIKQIREFIWMPFVSI